MIMIMIMIIMINYVLSCNTRFGLGFDSLRKTYGLFQKGKPGKPASTVYPLLLVVDKWQVVTRRQAVRGLTIFTKLSRKGHCLSPHPRPISLLRPLSLPHSFCVIPLVTDQCHKKIILITNRIE